jgi:hypothetical protein
MGSHLKPDLRLESGRALALYHGLEQQGARRPRPAASWAGRRIGDRCSKTSSTSRTRKPSDRDARHGRTIQIRPIGAALGADIAASSWHNRAEGKALLGRARLAK